MGNFSDKQVCEAAMQEVEWFFKGRNFFHLMPIDEKGTVRTDPIYDEDIVSFDSEWAKSKDAVIEYRDDDYWQVIVTCDIKWEGEEELDRAEQSINVYLDEGELVAEVDSRVG